MAELVIIVNKDAELGFRCAGFAVIAATDKDDISGLVEEITKEGKYGIILIEERFLEKIRPPVFKRIKKRGIPIIMPITLPLTWEQREFKESPILRLIRRSIGYQIKLKR